MAGRARRVHAGHEQQFHADETLALASLAAPLGDVEREPSGIVAAAARRGRGSEQLAHMVEQARVGESGRESGRERVCQYGEVWVGAGRVKKKNPHKKDLTD